MDTGNVKEVGIDTDNGNGVGLIRSLWSAVTTLKGVV